MRFISTHLTKSVSQCRETRKLKETQFWVAADKWPTMAWGCGPGRPLAPAWRHGVPDVARAMGPVQERTGISAGSRRIRKSWARRMTMEWVPGRKAERNNRDTMTARGCRYRISAHRGAGSRLAFTLYWCGTVCSSAAPLHLLYGYIIFQYNFIL